MGKGYLTAKDLQEIKEMIQKDDPDVTIEWVFEKKEKDKECQ